MPDKKIKILVFCLINSLTAVAAGGLIYVFLAKGTYINDFFGTEGTSASFITEILRNYAADFLWAYGMCFALITVISPRAALVVSCVFSGAWEAAQAFGIISGTGDFIDFILCVAASITAVMIFKKKEKRYEE